MSIMHGSNGIVPCMCYISIPTADGISIPCAYTSHLAPLSSPKLHMEVAGCKEKDKVRVYVFRERVTRRERLRYWEGGRKERELGMEKKERGRN